MRHGLPKAVGMLLVMLSLALPASAQTGTARIRLVLAAPDAQAVDVFLDGTRVLTNLAYASISDYLKVPEGTRKIAVTPAGQDVAEAVITADAVVEAGKVYSVAAIGLADTPALTFSHDLSAPGSGKARVRVIHLSPDAPGANVEVVDGPVLIRNLAFPQVSDYLEVDGGTYNLRVVAVGENSAFIQLPDTTLEPGTIYDVVAVGRLATIQVVVATHTPSETPAAAEQTSAPGQEEASQALPPTGMTDSYRMPILCIGLLLLASGVMLRRRQARA